MKYLKQFCLNLFLKLKDRLNEASLIQDRIDERKREYEMKYKIHFYGHH